MPKFQKLPKVADGARGPSAASKALFEEVPEPQEQRPIVSEGDVLFESTRAETAPGTTAWGWTGYAGLQIQLTSMEDMKDPTTGRVTQGRNRVARFENGYYLHKKKGNKWFEEDLAFLLDHPLFGVGKLFWKADDQRTIDNKIEFDRTLKFLQRNKAMVAELAGKLGIGQSEDFTLPTQPGA